VRRGNHRTVDLPSLVRHPARSRQMSCIRPDAPKTVVRVAPPAVGTTTNQPPGALGAAAESIARALDATTTLTKRTEV
jgi:hypothetical protein